MNPKRTILTVVLACSLLASVGASADWYSLDWSYRAKVTVNSSQVDGNLNDFPVYVDLSDMPAGFFGNVQSGGEDIRVTTADGSTETAVEVVTIDTSSETGEVHFKAPSVSGSSDTDFYLYYGNSGASAYATPEDVWDDEYLGAWHLDETPAGTNGTHQDSTSNDEDGTTQNGVTTDATGKLDGADSFDGTNDRVEFGDIDTSGQAMTVETWVQLKGKAQNSHMALATKTDLDGSWTSNFHLLWHKDDYFTFGWRTDAWPSVSSATSTISLDTWYHVAGVRETDGDTSIWVNGENDTDGGTQTITDNRIPNNVFVSIGDNMNGNWPLEGLLDEVRLSDSARSGDWISATYRNQNAPDTFLTIGATEIPEPTAFGLLLLACAAYLRRRR